MSHRNCMRSSCCVNVSYGLITFMSVSQKQNTRSNPTYFECDWLLYSCSSGIGYLKVNGVPDQKVSDSFSKNKWTGTPMWILLGNIILLSEKPITTNSTSLELEMINCIIKDWRASWQPSNGWWNLSVNSSWSNSCSSQDALAGQRRVLVLKGLTIH